MHTYIHAYTNTCTHTHTHIYIYICIHINASMFRYIHTDILDPKPKGVCLGLLLVCVKVSLYTNRTHLEALRLHHTGAFVIDIGTFEGFYTVCRALLT